MAGRSSLRLERGQWSSGVVATTDSVGEAMTDRGLICPTCQQIGYHAVRCIKAEGREQATLWALLLFDPEDVFEAVLDVGSKSDMEQAALEVAGLLARDYRTEVALVHSTVRTGKNHE